MCNYLDTILACDGQTDGQIVRAMHTSHAVKTKWRCIDRFFLRILHFGSACTMSHAHPRFAIDWIKWFSRMLIKICKLYCINGFIRRHYTPPTNGWSIRKIMDDGISTSAIGLAYKVLLVMDASKYVWTMHRVISWCVWASGHTHRMATYLQLPVPRTLRCHNSALYLWRHYQRWTLVGRQRWWQPEYYICSLQGLLPSGLHVLSVYTPCCGGFSS